MCDEEAATPYVFCALCVHECTGIGCQSLAAEGVNFTFAFVFCTVDDINPALP